MTSAPTVFVSSTCYDLQQIRADLRDFIEDQLGYHALISEHRSFPTDPDATTLENCKKAVEGADIFVLVIGGRYGSKTDGGRSITNIEYLEARARGIPIYVFVSKKIIATLPVWEKNRDGDFSGIVDDSALLEFVQTLRSEDGRWTFEFETAQEIIATLRAQLSFLMAESLGLRSKLRSSSESRLLGTLSGGALKLALEKRGAWPYYLFVQLVDDELASMRGMRREFDLGMALGSGDHVSLGAAFDWMIGRIRELRRIVDALNKLPAVIHQAVGPVGEAVSVEGLIFAARNVLGAMYRATLEWVANLRRASLPQEFEPVAQAMARSLGGVLDQLQEIGPSMIATLEAAMAGPTPPDGGPRQVNLTIALTLSMDEVMREMDAARARLDRLLQR